MTLEEKMKYGSWELEREQLLKQMLSLIVDNAYNEWNNISTIEKIFCSISFVQSSSVFQINQQLQNTQIP